MQRLILIMLLALSQLAAAGEAPPRPRVGLVLGGGGARGAAHIGVLEVLERLRVPVDCVAGTSMGALVAGVYASGMAPAEMRRELAKADWDALFQDAPPFSDRSFRNKVKDKRYLPASETGVGEDGLRYQTGIVTGQKIKLFFNQLVGDDRGLRRIEDLALPLSIVATDIVHGKRVVFRSGSLSSAMRASMSVPGLMSPVELDGQKLVDGGLVDNVPIGEARERCQADVVIAVNVGSPLLKADEIGSLLSVAAQMINILTEQNVVRSLATLRPSDIFIQPDLEGITAGDFKRTSETADRGVAAAEAAVAQLSRLSVSAADYAAWVAQKRVAPGPLPRVDDIEIAGLQRVHPVMIEKHLRLGPGEILDTMKLNDSLNKAYGDSYYENVDYSLITTLRERNILRVTPQEKSWGPNYLRYGVNLDTNFQSDSTYTLRAAYHKTLINPLGGELVFGAEIGSTNAVDFDYYQPLDPAQRYFFETNLRYGSQLSTLYENNDKIAQYRVLRGSAKAVAGINLGTLGQMRAGWEHNLWDPKLNIGSPFLPEESKIYGGWFGQIDLDETDRLYFPTNGWFAGSRYFDSPAEDYSRLDARAGVYHSIGDWVLSGRLTYQGSPVGQLPVYDAGSLGGMFNMTAFGVGQLKGDDIRYGNLRAERIIGRLPLGLRGDLRAGLMLEAARIGTPYTETQLKGWINSTALYLGGETPLGPAFLGYGYSSSGGGFHNLYLFLGTP
ncbi:MAG: NTE family protein RssA [Candidatus Accumulibacter adjunctus]|uniref:NTE family protein RssA n=1 Tax=Candidatus Accumulibacter adjunctus TaxID=1454001 RepID=A0A011PRN0_9PROT|nr:MAG: NTE family protein RssA [Candidatus Accumulibacter adjunctus]